MSKLKEPFRTIHGVVLPDLSFHARSGMVFSGEEMQAMVNKYRKVNRIHKPMALLLWTDVKNGHAANWKRQQIEE